MEWISVKDGFPNNFQDVFIYFVNESGKEIIIKGFYVHPRTILWDELMDDNYSDISFSDYDEEQDIYYAVSGWYENHYVSEVDYYLYENVIYWAIPEPPKDINND